MKRCVIIGIVIWIAPLFWACRKDGDKEFVQAPIEIVSPSPGKRLSEVSLSDRQKAYVRSANAFAWDLLQGVYEQEQGTFVFSPLSLQYVLSLALNGAEGETAAEIIVTLGGEADRDSLNAYCHLLLNQLPALTGDADVKVTNAVLLRKDCLLLDSFRETAESLYYAPVEYVDPDHPDVIVDRINEWASRNTNGSIEPFLNKGEMNDGFSAALLNALYFKAKWSSEDGQPMFLSEATLKGQPFWYDGGGEGKADYMRHSSRLYCCVTDEYAVAEFPYEGEKYALYVLLPNETGGNGLERMLSSLSEEKWTELLSMMENQAVVHIRLPKFEIDGCIDFDQILPSMGIRRAFVPELAEFDSVCAGHRLFISRIPQRDHFRVTEWGTEAASVTMAEMANGEVDSDTEKLKEINFFADHPFVFCLAEKTSGVILFAGVYSGD